MLITLYWKINWTVKIGLDGEERTKIWVRMGIDREELERENEHDQRIVRFSKN